jgi:hypothetical protein
MFRRPGAMWMLAAFAFWFSACGRTPKSDPHATPETNGEVRQITLHVPAMIDRQGIT